MSDVLELLKKLINGEDTCDINHLAWMAADRIEQLERENKLATKEALLMVQAMHKDFYSDSDGAELFEPLDTASGLLTQIDNMYAGIRNRYRELEQNAQQIRDGD